MNNFRTNISLDFTSFAEQHWKGICLHLAFKENCLNQQFVIFIFINIITIVPQWKKTEFLSFTLHLKPSINLSYTAK